MAAGGETRSKTSHRTPSQMKKHGKTYQASTKQKSNRAARGRNRTRMVAAGKAKKGDGKHVSHKTALAKGGGNGDKNLAMKKAKTNLMQGTKKG